MSEALIFASTNQQYELRVQYMKILSTEHGQNMFCACNFHGNSMNDLLSYCGLIDAKIRASDKDLPVCLKKVEINDIKGINLFAY